MHKFDYSFLDEGLLPAEIVNLTSTISAFNAISGERKERNKKIFSFDIFSCVSLVVG